MAAIVPVTSYAATAKPAAAKPIDPDSIKKGMAAAPGVITQAGLDCQLANARLLGKSTDPKTKVSSTYYELACVNQEGFIVATPDKAGTPVAIYTCLEAANNPGSGAQCVLPQNADPKQGLAALVAKSKPNCQITNARAIGQATDRTATVFEVACQGGPGYSIQSSFPVSASKPATFEPCFAISPSSPMKCTLTDDATSAAYVSSIVAKMGKPCTLKDRRYVGATSDGSNYFEVACQDGKGYMVEQLANGDVKPAIDCAIADNIGGGCTLTNARQAESEQDGLYTKLAHAAGYNCDVSRYAPFNVDVPGHEVVELACSNRPDGAVAIFPASSTEKAQIYDCAHSEVAGYRCSFTGADAAVTTLTADLNKLGKTSCVVSGSRFIAKTADGQGFVEVSCADGNPGFVISYTVGPPVAPKEALGCAVAKDILGGCQMPQNTKH
ncbi:MAG TPA: hypothetical protein VKQ70_13275 [Caulobacteraceae bacterium]|nr:hypothetical protein [Caulobacteraceae bacterium]